MRKGLFILVMLLPTLCFCQDKRPILKPYVGYLGFFDNREFYQSGLQPSTYFGQRISPGITAQLDTANLMVLSVNFLQEFGNPKLISGWQPEVYFRHQSPGLHFVFGAFPRENGRTLWLLLWFQTPFDILVPMRQVLLSNNPEKMDIRQFGWIGRDKKRNDFANSSSLVHTI